jgi:hypothetical protein
LTGRSDLPISDFLRAVGWPPGGRRLSCHRRWRRAASVYRQEHSPRELNLIVPELVGPPDEPEILRSSSSGDPRRRCLLRPNVNVIAPTKVVRTALRDAASVAGRVASADDTRRINHDSCGPLNHGGAGFPRPPRGASLAWWRRTGLDIARIGEPECTPVRAVEGEPCASSCKRRCGKLRSIDLAFEMASEKSTRDKSMRVFKEGATIRRDSRLGGLGLSSVAARGDFSRL